MEITGIVLRVSNKEKGFGVEIDSAGNWFNGFGVAPCKKGDKVKIDYEPSKDGKWKNVKLLEVLTASIESSSGRPDNSKDFRANVDAGNILQREVEVLAGLNLAEKTKAITEGNLGRFLVEEFGKIREGIKALDSEPLEEQYDD